MHANGVEAAITRYWEQKKMRAIGIARNRNCAQSELRANGERVLGGFTVLC